MFPGCSILVSHQLKPSEFDICFKFSGALMAFFFVHPVLGLRANHFDHVYRW